MVWSAIQVISLWSSCLKETKYKLKDICVNTRDFSVVYVFKLCIASVSSDGLDESVHMHRLAEVFAARIHNIWIKIKSQLKI